MRKKYTMLGRKPVDFAAPSQVWEDETQQQRIERERKKAKKAKKDKKALTKARKEGRA